jgi:O-antigen/teichoic acid export membrane protein
MHFLKEKLRLSVFSRNVMLVSAGTIVAQIIPSIISPIITRIYTPEEFGLYGIYMAIASLLVTIASGRYDLAIFIPDKINDSKRIVLLSIFLAALFSIFICFIIFPLNYILVNYLGEKEISVWLYTIPFIVFLISMFQVILQWLNKIKSYKGISGLRIVNSGIMSFLNLGFGFLDLKINGLILSTLVSQTILSLLTFKYIKTFVNLFSIPRFRALMKKYVNYPKFLLPSTLAGELAAQIPVILLSAFFGPATSGFYLLANKIMALPMSVVGGSIGSVYRQEAFDEFIKKGNCTELYKKTFRKMFIFGFFPFLIFFFGGKFIFSLIFGMQWVIAGEMASYLSVMIFFQILSTPMADTILLVNAQKIDLFLQIGRLTLSILSLLIGKLFRSYELGIILFSMSYSLYYIAHSIFQYKASKGLKTWQKT